MSAIRVFPRMVEAEADGDFPDLLFDHSGVPHRNLFWMRWKYGGDGYLP